MDDDDDCLEREHMRKRQKTTGKSSPSSSAIGEKANEPSPTAPNDAEKAAKKRLKKQLQKEKKAAAMKSAQENQKKTKDGDNSSKVIEKKSNARDGKKKSSNRFIPCRKGVKYWDVCVGKGPVLQDRKKAHVKYLLRAADGTKGKGKILDCDSNFAFRMGKREVIEGWDIGMVGMRQGGKRHLVVPKSAGYGMKDVGAGSGADLFFEITLISC
eukprot:CAMPEP_0195511788 /NCGR_PEP_ID=MMETSP0794_2-20130614/3984_1 /TAXON_ID=515487 /ORGANISM="Stephanopyxis turris, Strain CCMP 815" /LENGTH=212 /DNA_ID=CAMNT_0040639445 /DNA_START=536 /DNA_END=1174 /DNA_ORIENTATION=-